MQNSGLIKISTIHSFKGLEAQTVFCILTPEDEAEMVYTGITRAQRNLVVSTLRQADSAPFSRHI
jgi:superfamily I DNA/RNA helicase